MGFSGFFSGLEGQTQFVPQGVIHAARAPLCHGNGSEERHTGFISVHTQCKQPRMSSFLVTDFFLM